MDSSRFIIVECQNEPNEGRVVFCSHTFYVSRWEQRIVRPTGHSSDGADVLILITNGDINKVKFLLFYFCLRDDRKLSSVDLMEKLLSPFFTILSLILSVVSTLIQVLSNTNIFIFSRFLGHWTLRFFLKKPPTSRLSLSLLVLQWAAAPHRWNSFSFLFPHSVSAVWQTC